METKLSRKSGLLPGSLIHIGENVGEDQVISMFDYASDHFDFLVCKDVEECFKAIEQNSTTWVNIDGLHGTESIASLNQKLKVHPLTTEDVLNTRHRPKLEIFEDYIFVTLKMLMVEEVENNIRSEQVSFLLGPGYVVSFQERQGDVFENLRKRLSGDKGKIRERGADYLLYRLLDTVVDNYYYVTEFLAEKIDSLEDRVLGKVDQRVQLEIQNIRKQLLYVRKVTTPLREVMLGLEKDESVLLDEKTSRYFRDVYEHVIHTNDQLDSQRENLASVLDLYHSTVSNKMNSIMQLLTIVSTIFIPLTFIAGIYGMNFENMPELKTQYGYILVWAVMILVGLLMVMYFRRKKWL